MRDARREEQHVILCGMFAVTRGAAVAHGGAGQQALGVDNSRVLTLLKHSTQQKCSSALLEVETASPSCCCSLGSARSHYYSSLSQILLNKLRKKFMNDTQLATKRITKQKLQQIWGK